MGQLYNNNMFSLPVDKVMSSLQMLKVVVFLQHKSHITKSIPKIWLIKVDFIRFMMVSFQILFIFILG